ncbi:TPA: prevent-host-death protein [candidate division WWE3 bacterium]|uniref:Antitoxin n=1 Tax=candidate division WWE3 bacterium TaxID=2053526 RepID=A0A354G3X4_UNCKA|nr:prevent-host-death protein [candidate division WWE3 bacterium]HBI35712.1 prevent-host-death protein [candidate division WWE3 bacterium]
MYIKNMDKLISLSNARAKFPEIVRKVSTTLDRVVITVNGQPKATLVNSEELEALEETAEVLSIPGAKDSILEGLRQAKKGKGVALSDLE